jgi:hypothetical protein
MTPLQKSTWDEIYLRQDIVKTLTLPNIHFHFDKLHERLNLLRHKVNRDLVPKSSLITYLSAMISDELIHLNPKTGIYTYHRILNSKGRIMIQPYLSILCYLRLYSNPIIVHYGEFCLKQPLDSYRQEVFNRLKIDLPVLLIHDLVGIKKFLSRSRDNREIFETTIIDVNLRTEPELIHFS